MNVLALKDSLAQRLALLRALDSSGAGVTVIGGVRVFCLVELLDVVDEFLDWDTAPTAGVLVNVQKDTGADDGLLVVAAPQGASSECS